MLVVPLCYDPAIATMEQIQIHNHWSVPVESALTKTLPDEGSMWLFKATNISSISVHRSAQRHSVRVGEASKARQQS